MIRIPDFNESLMSAAQIGRNTGFLPQEKRVIVIKEISGAEEEVWLSLIHISGSGILRPDAEYLLQGTAD